MKLRVKHYEIYNEWVSRNGYPLTLEESQHLDKLDKAAEYSIGNIPELNRYESLLNIKYDYWNILATPKLVARISPLLEEFMKQLDWEE